MQHDPLASAWPHAAPRAPVQESQQENAWANYHPPAQVLTSGDRWVSQREAPQVDRWVSEHEAPPAHAPHEHVPSMMPMTAAWQRGAIRAGTTPYNPHVGQQLSDDLLREMMSGHTINEPARQAQFSGETPSGVPGRMLNVGTPQNVVPPMRQQPHSAPPALTYPVSSATPTLPGGRPTSVPAIDMQPAPQQPYHAVPVQVRKSNYLGIQDIAHINLERMAKDLEKEERERIKFASQMAKDARENEKRQEHNFFGGSQYDG